MRKLIIYTFVVGIMVGSLWLGGAARAQEDTTEVTVNLSEFKVEMSTTTVPANTPVKYIFINNGTIEHEVVLELAGSAKEAAMNVKEGKAEVEGIQSGQTESAVWTVDKPGQYQLACHIPGHYEGGMVQLFTVKAVRRSIWSQPLTWVVIVAALLVIIGLAVTLRRRSTSRRMAANP